MARAREARDASSGSRRAFPRSKALCGMYHYKADGRSELTQYNRKKDLESSTGKWIAEALSTDPWYKDLVPNVHITSSSQIDQLTTIDSRP